MEILKNVGFTEGNVDLFLSTKKSMKGLVNIALDVDGYLMVGSPDEMNEVVEQLKKNGLVVKGRDSL